MEYKAQDSRYDKMNYIRSGKSGLKMSAVSLGLWYNFGDFDNYFKAKEMIFESFDMGITCFDIANNYGPGPGGAERTFGKVLRDGLKAYRDEIIVTTKAGYYMWSGPYGEFGSRKYLLASLDKSLERIGADYVDIFYSHRFDPNTPLEETMGALSDVVKSGKALYVGISNYPEDKTVEAINILKNSNTPCVAHQLSYSMLNRHIENRMLKILAENGVGCVAYSPLAQGLLTSKYLKDIPEGSRASIEGNFLKKENITKELVEVLNQLNLLASKRGQSLSQMALSWCLRNPEVTSVIVGASSLSQIKENISCIDNVSFNESEIMEIDFLLNQLPKR